MPPTPCSIVDLSWSMSKSSAGAATSSAARRATGQASMSTQPAADEVDRVAVVLRAGEAVDVDAGPGEHDRGRVRSVVDALLEWVWLAC